MAQFSSIMDKNNIFSVQVVVVGCSVSGRWDVGAVVGTGSHTEHTPQYGKYG
jgi:hypothetical protein